MVTFPNLGELQQNYAKLRWWDFSKSFGREWESLRKKITGRVNSARKKNANVFSIGAVKCICIQPLNVGSPRH